MKTENQFGAAIATLQHDIDYYVANRECDPECHDSRVAELQEAIRILESQPTKARGFKEE